MWKLLGFSDEKDPEAAAAPQQLTMVRSRAVRQQDGEEEPSADATSMSKKGGSKSSDGTGGVRFTTCEFKSHGIRLDYFFFSSRRRHTRLTCDWSSDVCSSD